MKRLKPYLTYALWTLLGVSGIPLFIQEVIYVAHMVTKVRPLQASARTYLETFLDDQRQLAEEPLFELRQGSANAAPFLNFRLEWAPSTPSLVRQLSANPPRAVLADSVNAKLKSWGPNFPIHHSELRYEEIDLSWMAELSRYDYWDLVELSSVDEVFDNKIAMSLYFTQTLSAEFEKFVFAAKVRLMKGLFEGDIPTAMEEVHHFARLLYTTETLMGAMAAIAILRAERTLYDYLHINIQSGTIGEWTALDRSQIDRARRSVLAFNAYLTVFTPADVLKKTFMDENVHVGICSALAKGILRGLLTRPLLEPQFPLERDFRAAYRNLDEVMESNAERCRLKHLKEMWAVKRSRLVWVGLVGDHSWDWINLHLSRHLPMLRKAWGVDLTSLFLSNGLDSYKNPLE